MITDVRPNSAGARAGVKVGDEVVTIGGVPVHQATDALAPKFLTMPSAAARDWALNVALAGSDLRKFVSLTVRSPGKAARRVRWVFAPPRYDSLVSLTSKAGVATIRINNSLGDEATIAEFDQALAKAVMASSIVLDLTDTPSGGNSLVARGIMGRFVVTERPYQRHEYVAEYRRSGVRRLWIEEVAPRGPWIKKPLEVHVGAWTGSMGEGLAIGLAGAAAAPVRGRPMAGLLGALGEFPLPVSGITLRLPVEALAHVDGTPREMFIPAPM
jgi:carboxyl-terminal processing protease